MKKIFLLTIFSMIFLALPLVAAWDANLVAYYPTNETSGTNLTDYSGNGYWGTTINMENGDWSGNSIRFDGVDERISLPSYSIFGGGSDFAISFCFTSENREKSQYVVQFWNEADIGVVISQDFPTNSEGLKNIGGWHNINGDPVANNTWYSYVYQYSASTGTELWMNGSNVGNDTTTGSITNPSGASFIGADTSGTGGNIIGNFSNMTIFSRLLTPTEIQGFNCGGAAPAAPNSTSITLNSPTNNSVISQSSVYLNATYNITSTTGLAWTNTTYNIWFSNSTLFNSTTISVTGTDNNTKQIFQNLILGDYIWNVQGTYANASNVYTNSSVFNNSFTIGANLLTLTFNNITWETSSETFSAVFSLLSGSQVSLARLVYNGTNYTISNTTTSGGNITLSKTLNIPLNANGLNQTNNFSFAFTYTGNSTQTSPIFNQSVGNITFQSCNPTYSSKAINASLLDESTELEIDPSLHATDLEGYFTYWLGTGAIYKNYSYSSLASATLSNYTFCLDPVDLGMRLNSQLLYDAADYSARQYFINNGSISASVSNLGLYLLNDSAAVKFTLTAKQGTNFITSSYVTIAKFFIGDGQYKTISVRQTDDSGEFTEYLDLDRDYRYSVVQNGTLLGTIDKRATCATAPCTLTLNIDTSQGDIWSSYNATYGANILSNLTYDGTTKIVTYSFIDITGLAQYFRLEANRTYYNSTTESICNTFSYSSSGTITCNLTNYYGDFVIRTYVSRSPEKIDQILTIAIGEIKESLGTIAVFISFFLILTLVMAGAAVSGGNPSVILFMFGISILITKLMTFFPFSWAVVAVLELAIIFLISQVKS